MNHGLELTGSGKEALTATVQAAAGALSGAVVARSAGLGRHGVVVIAAVGATIAITAPWSMRYLSVVTENAIDLVAGLTPEA